VPHGNKFATCLLHFLFHSGMVQSVARGPLEPKILVRVQVPEPSFNLSHLFQQLVYLPALAVAPRLDFAETARLDS
jgi:hypothetical protein